MFESLTPTPQLCRSLSLRSCNLCCFLASNNPRRLFTGCLRVVCVCVSSCGCVTESVVIGALPFGVPKTSPFHAACANVVQNCYLYAPVVSMNFSGELYLLRVCRTEEAQALSSHLCPRAPSQPDQRACVRSREQELISNLADDCNCYDMSEHIVDINT